MELEFFEKNLNFILKYSKNSDLEMEKSDFEIDLESVWKVLKLVRKIRNWFRKSENASNMDMCLLYVYVRITILYNSRCHIAEMYLMHQFTFSFVVVVSVSAHLDTTNMRIKLSTVSKPLVAQ